MFLGADRLVFQNAEALPYRMTVAEELLWEQLKGKRLGVKFRRQHPLGIYIADFYCHQHKLIIELDGSIHNLPDVIQNDIVRQNNLVSDGLKVLRFTNDQVLNNLEKVLENINTQIKSSPFRGRGGQPANHPSTSQTH